MFRPIRVDHTNCLQVAIKTHLSSPSGHTTGNCSPGQTFKKLKYLSACDREERGRGEGTADDRDRPSQFV
jgi:hypothetical protein